MGQGQGSVRGQTTPLFLGVAEGGEARLLDAKADHKELSRTWGRGPAAAHLMHQDLCLSTKLHRAPPTLILSLRTHESCAWTLIKENPAGRERPREQVVDFKCVLESWNCSV